jgi:hypothetical protein
MGSTGTGNFSDYSGGGSSGGKSGPKQQGGSSGTSDCTKPIKGLQLEDVERSAYFRAHGAVPRKGVAVVVSTKLKDGRLSVETLASREIIGLLPTRLNYLTGCMAKGHRYEGTVTASTLSPLASVTVDLDAR